MPQLSRKAAALPAAIVAALAALGANGQPKRTLAVTYFDVNGGGEEYRVLGKGLADMLITDLLVVKSIALVERAKLNAALDELKLAKSPYIDPSSAVKLGKGLSATHMLTGAITVLGPKMRIDARVLEVQTGEVRQGKQVDGEAQEFFALEKELVDLLVAAMDLKPDLKEKAALRKSQTESFEAIRGYSKGLDALDKGDRQAAQAAFATAARADPAWPALKEALERLTKELDAAEAKAALTLEQKLEALRADDPELYKKVERLSDPDGVPYGERHLARLQVLGALAKRGLRPRQPRYAGKKVGASAFEYWEAKELGSVLGAFGDDPQSVAASPALMLYLVTKYSDDPTFLERMHEEVQRRWKAVVARTDFSKAPPEVRGSGDNVDRLKAHHAWLNVQAKVVPLPVGASREPVKAMARVEEMLKKEADRRLVELRSEVKRLMGVLDTAKDSRDATEKVDAVLDAINAQDDWAFRLEQTRLRIAVTRWMVEHPDIKPFHGTAEKPFWLEMSDLLGWMTRFDDDPDCWELIPGAGEYLLKKYAGADYLTSQLRLHLNAIDSMRKEQDRARRRWEEEFKRNPEKQAAPEARDLFKRAAEAGRKWKAK